MVVRDRSSIVSPVQQPGIFMIGTIQNISVLHLRDFTLETRLISIESQPKKIVFVVVVVIGAVVVVIVVHVVVVVIPVVDPRNIRLKFG